MNVYDFDNTIYDGESSLEFFLFCARKNRSLLRLIPAAFRTLIKYKLCLISSDDLHALAGKYAAQFVHMLDDAENMTRDFWDQRMHKIKPFYLENRQPDDLVISASCDFLLEEIMNRLNIKNCLCSIVNRQTGNVEQMCYRQNKVDIYRRNFGDKKIDRFYTDSMNDKPMIEIAEQAFLVRGSRITQIK